MLFGANLLRAKYEKSKLKPGFFKRFDCIFGGIEEKNKPMDELPNIAEKIRSFFWFCRKIRE